jgi:hypothetical protein
MTLEARLVLLAQAIGPDVKALIDGQGTLASLSTAAQGNLVAAINEIHTEFDALINDGSLTTSTTEVWSANQITAVVNQAKTDVTATILDGAPGALDTLNELAAALADDPSFAGTMTTALGNRLRFDAVQTLTAPQKVQGLTNLGAVATLDLGNFDVDLVAAYVTAKS